MTVEEREQALWVASQRYINGDINIDELEAVERGQAGKNEDDMFSRHSAREALKRRFWSRWMNGRVAS